MNSHTYLTHTHTPALRRFIKFIQCQMRGLFVEEHQFPWTKTWQDSRYVALFDLPRMEREIVGVVRKHFTNSLCFFFWMYICSLTNVYRPGQVSTTWQLCLNLTHKHVLLVVRVFQEFWTWGKVKHHVHVDEHMIQTGGEKNTTNLLGQWLNFKLFRITYI